MKGRQRDCMGATGKWRGDVEIVYIPWNSIHKALLIPHTSNYSWLLCVGTWDTAALLTALGTGHNLHIQGHFRFAHGLLKYT